MTQILTLEQVLDFVNLYYADDRLDIEIPALYNSKLFYQAFWRRDNEEPRWLVGIKGSSDLQPINSQDLITFLNENKLDLVEFQISLMDRILLNVGQIALIIKQARVVFTDELVDEAIDRVEEIYQQIDNTIQDIIESKPQKDQAPAKKPKKSKLKLVKDSSQDE